jgi:hypothetical protein
VVFEDVIAADDLAAVPFGRIVFEEEPAVRPRPFLPPSALLAAAALDLADEDVTYGGRSSLLSLCCSSGVTAA